VSSNSYTGEVRATVRLVQSEVVGTSLLRAGQGSPLHNGHGGQRPRKRTQIGGFGRSVGPLARGWLRHSVRGGRRSRGLLKNSLRSSRRVYPGVGYGTRLIEIFRAKVPERRTTRRPYQITCQFAQCDSCCSNCYRYCGKDHYWNRVAEKLYGWLASEVLGRNISEITVPPDTEKQAAAVTNS
jgi:hypothetical protein